MEQYLAQLMEDLQKATSNLKTMNDENEPVDFSQVEKFENGITSPISEITGFDQEQFPPGEKLSQHQQALLAEKLEELLEHFHFKLDFPDNYPAHLRYPFIRELWSEEQVAVTDGTIHIEFCEYDEDHCPFPGYCNTCKEAFEYVNYYKKRFSEDFPKDSEEVEDLFFDSADDDDGPYTEDINGFYDDDGNKIDLNSIPVPSLCVICKSNQVDDWEENLLCLMNRNDQRNNKDFICGAFEKQ